MGNSKSLFVTFILFTFLLVGVGFVSSATITVNSGDSIQNAINSASEGDVIEVMGGDYEPFWTGYFTENLTIKSAEGHNPKIIANSSNVNSRRAIWIFTDHTKVIGFNITGNGDKDLFTGIVGISITGNDITVENNTLNSLLTGIQTKATTDVTANARILNNNISDSKVGISLQGYGNTVDGNNIIADEEGFGIASGNTNFGTNNIQTSSGVAAKISFHEIDKYSGSIQDGVNAVNQGDVVEVDNGTFEEDVFVNKPIILRGFDNPATNPSVINGTIHVQSDGAVVEKLKITNTGRDGEIEGIFVGDASGYTDDSNEIIEIKNNIIEKIRTNDDLTVEGIHVKSYDNGDAINGIIITNNTIRDVIEDVKGSNGIKIQSDVNNVEISKNTVEDLDGGWAWGISVTYSGGESGLADNVSITRNIFKNINAPGGAIGIESGGDGDGDLPLADEIETHYNGFFMSTFTDAKGVVNTNQDGIDLATNASYNYWGSTNPDFDSLISGDVITEPFLNNPSETTPNTPEISSDDENGYTNNNLIKLILDAAGNLPDLFRLSLDKSTWTAWKEWGHSNQKNITDFDLTNSSLGGNSEDGNKTVHVEAKSYTENKNSTINNASVVFDTKKANITANITKAFFNGTYFIFSPENQDGNFDSIDIIMNSSEIIKDWGTTYVYNSTNDQVKYFSSPYGSPDNIDSLIKDWNGDSPDFADGFVPTGLYTINTTTTDLADNINDNIKVAEVFVDNKAPSFNGFSITTNNPEKDSNVQINTTASDESGIKEVFVEIKGNNYTASSDNSGNFFLTINSGNYTANEILNYTWYAKDVVGNVNSSENSFKAVSKPVINSNSPSQIFNIQESKNQTFSITVDDEDIDDSFTYNWSLDENSVGENQSNYTFTTDYNSSGTYKLVAKVTDSFGFSDSFEWTINVEDNKKPSVKSSSPSVNSLAIKTESSKKFSVSVTDPENDALNYEWFVNSSSVQSGNNNSFIFNSQNNSGEFEILVNTTDPAGNFMTKSWTLTVSPKPVSKTFKPSSGSTDLTKIANPEEVVNFKLANEKGKLDFGNEVLDLSNVIDIDNTVKIENNVVSVDTENHPELNKSATITMTGLSYDTVPTIFYNEGFTTNSNEINSECEFCELINYTSAPTTNGQITFRVEHFTSFRVSGSGQNFDFDLLKGLDSCINREKGNLTLSISDPDNEDEFDFDETIDVETEVQNDADEDKDVITEVILYNIDKDNEEEKIESDDIEVESGEDTDFDFELNIPEDFEENDDYMIFVKSYEEDREETQCSQSALEVNFHRDDENVAIKKLTIDRENITSGERLGVSVDIQNVGTDDQDVYVTLSVDELGVSEISDEIELEGFGEDDSETVFFNLRIPENTEPKTYELRATVDFDGGSNDQTTEFTVERLPSVVSEHITLNSPQPQSITGRAVSESSKLSPGEKTITTLLLMILALSLLIVFVYFRKSRL